MGNCKHCGKPAGFLRRSHKECKNKHRTAKEKVESLIENADLDNSTPESINTQIQVVSDSGHINGKDLSDALLTGWEKAVNRAFDDGILTKDEDELLYELLNTLPIPEESSDRNGAKTKLVRGAILREVMNGEIPERISIIGDFPFNLQKSETLIWLFQDVEYLEDKTRTQYVGGSQGVGIRIAKGVYYKVGAFKGERISTSETTHVDTGLFGITNKHIYFSGDEKSFRIKLDKIVSFKPSENGITIHKDTASAKPQSFITDDGWFTYNLVKNLAKLM